jgi:hypothetical protein
MNITSSKTYHNGIIRKSIRINQPYDVLWNKLSDIVGLPSWVIGVAKTEFLSKIKRNVGAVRLITLDDGTKIRERITGWNDKNYFSYIATSGLPLRSYHATISLKPLNKKETTITWKSHFNSKEMTKTEFEEVVKSLEDFYKKSLATLKKSQENKP